MHVLLAVMAWLAGLLLWMPAAFAQGAEDAGVKLRVAVALVRFAELPGPPRNGLLQWCVATHADPPPAVLALQGRKVGSTELRLRLTQEFEGCDVLYVDSSFEDWRELLAGLPAPVLTVSDIPGFLAAGGMVELVLESDAVRFDVNLRALRAQSIRLPPQVLSLARQVRN